MGRFRVSHDLSLPFAINYDNLIDSLPSVLEPARLCHAERAVIWNISLGNCLTNGVKLPQ